MWHFANLEDIESSPYQMEILGENSLNIVEGKHSNCYLCGKREHMRIQIPQYKPLQVQKQYEKMKQKGSIWEMLMTWNVAEGWRRWGKGKKRGKAGMCN